MEDDTLKKIFWILLEYYGSQLESLTIDELFEVKKDMRLLEHVINKLAEENEK